MADHAHKLEIFRGLIKFKSNTQEIWGVLLLLSIITAVEVVLGIFYEEIGYGPLSLLFQIIIIIPSISVTSRRLQDRGISGWWQLSYLIIIGFPVITILCMLPAKEDENKWGKNPLLS